MSRKIEKFLIGRSDVKKCIVTAVSSRKQEFFPSSRAEEKTLKTGGFMKKGLSKQRKTTEIYFNESNPIIEVFTHNTDLKKRLSEYAQSYPDYCRQTDDDEQGGLRFEIQKGRFSFRLTAPYSAKRKEAASKYARENSYNAIKTK